jgi:hypothetical protein
MARSVGLEPTTFGFVDRCSIQLSYERKALLRAFRNLISHSNEHTNAPAKAMSFGLGAVHTAHM